ncbi:hypothetical protein AB0C74_05730 [Spirillospora sp. NPDC048832]
MPDGAAEAADPRAGQDRRGVWASIAVTLVVLLPFLAWTLVVHTRGPRTIHVELRPTAIQVPATLNPAGLLPDNSDPIVANCKAKRGRTKAYRAEKVRTEDGTYLGTLTLFGNPEGGCGVAWAEFKSEPVARRFVDLHIKSITMSLRREPPLLLTSTQDEYWGARLTGNAHWRDIWTDALRITPGAVFAVEITIVV